MASLPSFFSWLRGFMRTSTGPLIQENKLTGEGSDSTEERLSPLPKRRNTRSASPVNGFHEDGASWTVASPSSSHSSSARGRGKHARDSSDLCRQKRRSANMVCKYHMMRFMIPVSKYYIAKGGWKCAECKRDGEGAVKHCINCNTYDRCDACDAKGGFDDVNEKK